MQIIAFSLVTKHCPPFLQIFILLGQLLRGATVVIAVGKTVVVVGKTVVVVGSIDISQRIPN